MRIIDLVDDKIVINSECLCIEPFDSIWKSDKTKVKTDATNKIKYIWFYSDFDSPYFMHPEKERHNMIVDDVIKDKSFKTDKTIQKAIEKYTELHLTPAMRMLDAANSVIFKMESYFRTVDFNKEDDPEKIQKMMIAMPKTVSALNEAKKQCMTESLSGSKVRGNADIGMFEDGK